MQKTRLSGTLPWTKSCFVCGESNPRGLRLKSRLQDGKVLLNYTARESDLGWKHAVHGGIMMTLLDEVMTWAAIIASGKPCVAAEVSVRLTRPVHPADELQAEAEVVKLGRKLIETSGILLNSSGETVSKATGKYMPMAGDQFELSRTDFVSDPGTLQPEDIFAV